MAELKEKEEADEDDDVDVDVEQVSSDVAELHIWYEGLQQRLILSHRVFGEAVTLNEEAMIGCLRMIDTLVDLKWKSVYDQNSDLYYPVDNSYVVDDTIDVADDDDDEEEMEEMSELTYLPPDYSSIANPDDLVETDMEVEDNHELEPIRIMSGEENLPEKNYADFEAGLTADVMYFGEDPHPPKSYESSFDTSPPQIFGKDSSFMTEDEMESALELDAFGAKQEDVYSKLTKEPIIVDNSYVEDINEEFGDAIKNGTWIPERPMWARPEPTDEEYDSGKYYAPYEEIDDEPITDDDIQEAITLCETFKKESERIESLEPQQEMSDGAVKRSSRRIGQQSFAKESYPETLSDLLATLGTLKLEGEGEGNHTEKRSPFEDLF